MTFFKLIIVLALMGISTPIWGKAGSELSEIELAQKELMEGYQLIRANKVKEGIRVLRRAYRAYPSPEILMLLGKVYDRFSQGCSRSLSTWRLLVNTCHDDCPHAQEALARLKLSEIECRGKLSIKTQPTKAEVFIGDQLQGITPFEMEVSEARSFKLTIFKSDYKVIEHQVQLKRKWSKHEVNLKLESPLNRRGAKSSSIETKNKNDSVIVKDSKISQKKVSSSQQTKTIKNEQTPQVNLQQTKKIISAPLEVGENPFLRLEDPLLITDGKIARSAGRSMISDLRCEYRTRFKRYVKLKECDAAQLAMLDRFYLALYLQQDAYVYVIMNNQRGQWQLIYPSPMEDHLIKANTFTTIPHKEWILLDEIEDTTDVISILASPQPIEVLEQQRTNPDLSQVPRSLMRYFLPMSNSYKGKVTSAQVMNRQTKNVMKGPLVLHTSYRIYR